MTDDSDSLELIRGSDIEPETRRLRPFAWRPWQLDAKYLTLQYVTDTGRVLYEVDLDRCLTSAAVLDWIAQVRHKVWADDRVIAGLVHALDDVLHLQSNLCGCGMDGGPDHALDGRRIRQLVAQAVGAGAPLVEP
jgi:hypothetical protein